MTHHRKRFERWRKHLAPNAAYLVDQVLARVVPELERRDFRWHPDYAGGETTHLAHNTIPLQRRTGALWATVELQFHPRRPMVNVNFAALPPVCRRVRLEGDGVEEIPRERAVVHEGSAWFALCKGRKSSCTFGDSWFALFPRRRLDAEVDRLCGLLPELFALFDGGLPDAWTSRSFGHVSEHVLRLWSLNAPRG